MAIPFQTQTPEDLLMLDALSGPWPWYVSGSLIGLFVPVLLLLGNKQLGISSNLRHLCAALAPGRVEFFRYDWRRDGIWNMTFLAGVLVGGFLAARMFGTGAVDVSPETTAALTQMGIRDFSGLAPADIFSWSHLATLRGAVVIVGGGLLVGFGTAYAGGCTSGHAIAGLAALDRASLVAVLGFFGGGLLCTHVILPLLF